MIEARGSIDNVDNTKAAIEASGGKLIATYSFKDIIFVPIEGDYSLNDDFLRVRVYSDSAVVVRKKTEIKEFGKTSNVMLKKEFINENEAVSFVDKKFGLQFKRRFEYSRIGFEYAYENAKIFVENIDILGPSVEVEANTRDEIMNVFGRLGINKELGGSVPEVIHQLRKKPRVRSV